MFWVSYMVCTCCRLIVVMVLCSLIFMTTVNKCMYNQELLTKHEILCSQVSLIKPKGLVDVFWVLIMCLVCVFGCRLVLNVCFYNFYGVGFLEQQ